MKFLCLKCNSQMNYESQEQVDTLRLGITFACTGIGVDQPSSRREIWMSSGSSEKRSVSSAM